MKTIVISGINIFQGGPLSIYKDCLNSIIGSNIHINNKIIIFVHKKELFTEYVDKFTVIELPLSRKSYFFRIWYEYIYFYFFSIRTNIDIWLSIHDITPNVKAKHRYVYCHNASPFYRMTLFEKRHSRKMRLFNLFYKYLYKINIRKNDGIIVQQFWMKRKFQELYGVNQIIVSYPSFSMNQFYDNLDYNESKTVNNIFFYPSFPRIFKNFEIICNATRQLVSKGINDFEVVLTIDGSENKYTKDIVSKYSDIQNIKFIGLLSRESVFEYYKKSKYLIFPSKLESWGLPITEYKIFNKPMILANLDYAKEALGDYDRVAFFNPYKAEELSNIMEKIIKKEDIWRVHKFDFIPDANSWDELFNIVLGNGGR